MALGYCMACSRLVPIVKGPSVSSERRYDYYPVAHERSPTHAECGGVVEDGVCQQCGEPAEWLSSAPGEYCSGHKRAIT